jgi:Putative peptidoglycan binding domain/Transglycosylase SLT domain
MPDFTRVMTYTSPLARGPDVLCVQRALRALGFQPVEVDGVYGAQTAAAVKAFQTNRGIQTTGVVDQTTWLRLLQDPGTSGLSRELKDIVARLSQPQRFRDSVSWRLSTTGVAVDGHQPVGTAGLPITVQTIWKNFGDLIAAAATANQVPVELIVATIGTESSGDPKAERHEPGWVSNDTTPRAVSLGLMQTLVSTARSQLGDDNLLAATLLDPKTSINAGTRYIASQFSQSGFDPPKVACAYNAGGIYYDPSRANSWRMRQFPIGSPDHANRFIAFFNDCFSLIGIEEIKPQGPSFASALRPAAIVTPPVNPPVMASTGTTG